jgi:hypothetical protein
MALTVKQLRQRLRGIFGDAEDSSRDVENLAATMQGQLVTYRNSEANGTITAFVQQVVFTAVNKCRLVSARYVQSISSSVSATDAYRLLLIKRKAPSWSLTFLAAYLTASTDGLEVNLAGASNPLTLSSLSAEFEMAPGDTLSLEADGGGATVEAVPQGLLVLEIG